MERKTKMGVKFVQHLMNSIGGKMNEIRGDMYVHHVVYKRAFDDGQTYIIVVTNKNVVLLKRRHPGLTVRVVLCCSVAAVAACCIWYHFFPFVLVLYRNVAAIRYDNLQ